MWETPKSCVLCHREQDSYALWDLCCWECDLEHCWQGCAEQNILSADTVTLQKLQRVFQAFLLLRDSELLIICIFLILENRRYCEITCDNVQENDGLWCWSQAVPQFRLDVQAWVVAPFCFHKWHHNKIQIFFRLNVPLLHSVLLLCMYQAEATEVIYMQNALYIVYTNDIIWSKNENSLACLGHKYAVKLIL